jgi:hypothetical protein
MKNAGIAGGLVLIGLGLVTIGLGDFASRAQAFHRYQPSPEPRGGGCGIWECDALPSGSHTYAASVDAGSLGQPDWATTSMELTPTFSSWSGQWGSGSDIESVEVFLSATGVEFTGGDVTFPTGSTFFGGDETASLQDMYSQVVQHEGLHGQHASNIQALTERLEKLEAIIASLPECACSSDVNRDGLVNGADLGMMLGDWGPCQR